MGLDPEYSGSRQRGSQLPVPITSQEFPAYFSVQFSLPAKAHGVRLPNHSYFSSIPEKSQNPKIGYFRGMANNSELPKVKGKPGRKPGSKDVRPRQPRGVSANFIPSQGSKSPKVAVVPAWVKNKGLSPKHALFVAEYMVDKNPKAAAIRAGYKESCAARIGCDLLHHRKETREAIEQALEAQQVRTGITADRVLQELANIAFGKPTAVMTWGPGGIIIKDSETMEPGDVALVAEVSETKPTDKGGGSMKVKLHDKMKALELIGRTLGIFQDVSRVQVQEVPMAGADSPEAATFQDVMSRAKDRWKSQGYLGAPRQG